MSTKLYGLIINIASSILMSNVDSWKSRMILQLFGSRRSLHQRCSQSVWRFWWGALLRHGLLSEKHSGGKAARMIDCIRGGFGFGTIMKSLRKTRAAYMIEGILRTGISENRTRRRHYCRNTPVIPPVPTGRTAGTKITSLPEMSDGSRACR